MIVAKNADPGYLIPADKQDAEERSRLKIEKKEEARQRRRATRKEGEESEESVDTPPEDRMVLRNICKRCGLEREHHRVAHCSRCDRCVDYMDHHCVFTDNCVG